VSEKVNRKWSHWNTTGQFSIPYADPERHNAQRHSLIVGWTDTRSDNSRPIMTIADQSINQSIFNVASKATNSNFKDHAAVRSANKKAELSQR